MPSPQPSTHTGQQTVGDGQRKKLVSAVGPLCARHPLAAPAYPHDPTWEEQSYLISQQLEKPNSYR